MQARTLAARASSVSRLAAGASRDKGDRAERAVVRAEVAPPAYRGRIASSAKADLMNRSAFLKNALADNAASVAGFLLGQHNAAMSSKIELRFGRKGSVSLVISGPKKGSYYDHKAGCGGDLLNLIQRLIDRYRESVSWHDLSTATRRQRENIFQRAIATSGNEPFTAITRATIMACMERRRETPAAARHFLQSFRGLFE